MRCGAWAPVTRALLCRLPAAPLPARVNQTASRSAEGTCGVRWRRGTGCGLVRGGGGPDVLGAGVLGAEGDGAEGVAEPEGVCRRRHVTNGHTVPTWLKRSFAACRFRGSSATTRSAGGGCGAPIFGRWEARTRVMWRVPLGQNSRVSSACFFRCSSFCIHGHVTRCAHQRGDSACLVERPYTCESLSCSCVSAW